MTNNEPIRPTFEPDAGPTKSASASMLDYLQLMRLPNVFTAMADIGMGYLFVVPTNEVVSRLPTLILLVLASSCLYTAGMVLNDVFDIEIDRKERPNRPLPSGRISLAWARQFGGFLLVCGVILAMTASSMNGNWASGLIAVILACVIVAYDASLKHTPLGPIAMGSCRTLNIALGMSAIAPINMNSADGAAKLLVMLGMGLYIAGVTWFAKSEATMSRRPLLVWGLLVMTAGISLEAAMAWKRPIHFSEWNFALLLLMLCFPILRRAIASISDPSPGNVQGTVKTALMSLIPLNAAIALAVNDARYAVCILLLAVPMWILGRRVYST